MAISETSVNNALKILENALQQQSGNLQILSALVSFYHQLGKKDKALKFRKQAEAVLQYEP